MISRRVTTALIYFVIFGALAGIAVLLLAGCAPAGQGSKALPVLPTPAPAKPPPKWQGKDQVVMVYWVSYCGYCQRELGEFDDNQQRVHDAGLGVVFLQLDDPIVNMTTWPNLAGRLPADVQNVPYLELLVKDAGSWYLIWRHIGYVPLDIILEQLP